MKINIGLTQRHIAFCYAIIDGQSINQFGALAFELQRAIKESTAPEDICFVDVQPSMITDIYKRASGLSSGYANGINLEIKTMLLPQLMAKSFEPEILEVLQSLQAFDLENKQRLIDNTEAITVKIKAA